MYVDVFWSHLLFRWIKTLLPRKLMSCLAAIQQGLFEDTIKIQFHLSEKSDLEKKNGKLIRFKKYRWEREERKMN